MRRGATCLRESFLRLAALVGAMTVAGCVRLGPDFEPPRETWISRKEEKASASVITIRANCEAGAIARGDPDVAWRSKP
jgi:hypothetical protein